MLRMLDGHLYSLPAVGTAGALVAVACCAGPPLVGAVLGGLTMAGFLGLAGGVVLLATALSAALVVLRGRIRRACSPPNGQVAR